MQQRKREIVFATKRILGVVQVLASKPQKFAGQWFSFGSSIVYVTAAVCRLCWDSPALEDIRESVLDTTQQIVKLWMTAVAPPDSKTIGTLEGVHGVELLPAGAMKVDAKWKQAADDVGDMKLEEKEKESAEAWTRLVMLQRLVLLRHNRKQEATTLLRKAIAYCRQQVFPKSKQLSLRTKNKVQKYTVTQAMEDRIYLATHIILAITEYGNNNSSNNSNNSSSSSSDESKELPVWTPEDATEFGSMLSHWLKLFMSGHRKLRIDNNELVLEIAACLLILKLGDDPSVQSLLTDLDARRVDRSWARDAPPGKRESVYVESITNDQPRGIEGGLYVDYHTHALLALLYVLDAQQNAKLGAKQQHSTLPPPLRHRDRIDSLSDEQLAYMFNFLTVTERMFDIRLVQKRWQRVDSE